jgi:hypothetical protein
MGINGLSSCAAVSDLIMRMRPATITITIIKWLPQQDASYAGCKRERELTFGSTREDTEC